MWWTTPCWTTKEMKVFVRSSLSLHYQYYGVQSKMFQTSDMEVLALSIYQIVGRRYVGSKMDWSIFMRPEQAFWLNPWQYGNESYATHSSTDKLHINLWVLKECDDKFYKTSRSHKVILVLVKILTKTRHNPDMPKSQQAKILTNKNYNNLKLLF